MVVREMGDNNTADDNRRAHCADGVAATGAKGSS
jgi:hypothetical protein